MSIIRIVIDCRDCVAGVGASVRHHATHPQTAPDDQVVISHHDQQHVACEQRDQTEERYGRIVLARFCKQQQNKQTVFNVYVTIRESGRIR